MIRPLRRLTLNRTTLRRLDGESLRHVAGGTIFGAEIDPKTGPKLPVPIFSLGQAQCIPAEPASLGGTCENCGPKFGI